MQEQTVYTAPFNGNVPRFPYRSAGAELVDDECGIKKNVQPKEGLDEPEDGTPTRMAWYEDALDLEDDGRFEKYHGESVKKGGPVVTLRQ